MSPEPFSRIILACPKKKPLQHSEAPTSHETIILFGSGAEIKSQPWAWVSSVRILAEGLSSSAGATGAWNIPASSDEATGLSG